MARNKVRPGRMTAKLDGEFVVFLIGMRVNKPWKPHKWLPVFNAMPKMLAELSRHPELGLLGYRMAIGSGGPVLIQYWRSSEQLIEYAKAADSAHLPAWRKFNRAVGTSGDVGVWHETFVVRPGAYETLYANMPKVGLAKFAEHIEVGKRGDDARARLTAG